MNQTKKTDVSRSDALIAAGKPVLGFMNPWLYKNGYKAFTDITSGSTLGCNRKGFPVSHFQNEVRDDASRVLGRWILRMYCGSC